MFERSSALNCFLDFFDWGAWTSALSLGLEASRERFLLGLLLVGSGVVG